MEAVQNHPVYDRKYASFPNNGVMEEIDDLNGLIMSDVVAAMKRDVRNRMYLRYYISLRFTRRYYCVVAMYW